MLPEPSRKRKKKVDFEALNAPLMQIPCIKVTAVRGLLNAGIREIYELAGRSPEVLFEEAAKRTQEFDPKLLPYFRMAVYFAETEDPDPSRLSPHAWED